MIKLQKVTWYGMVCYPMKKAQIFLTKKHHKCYKQLVVLFRLVVYNVNKHNKSMKGWK